MEATGIIFQLVGVTCKAQPSSAFEMFSIRDRSHAQETKLHQHAIGSEGKASKPCIRQVAPRHMSQI